MCTCSILGRYIALLPLVWFTRLGINPPAFEHKETVLRSPSQKKPPNKHLQKVINPYEYKTHLLKARFITAAYKVQGHNSHLCFGLMFKSDSNKFKSLELCSCLGQIWSDAKCYSSTNLLNGHVCMDHPGTKCSVHKSLFFFFQIFFSWASILPLRFGVKSSLPV